MKKLLFPNWKELLLPADIIVTQGDGIDSFFIRQITQSPYSHSCISTGRINGNPMMIEATYPDIIGGEDKRRGVMMSHAGKYNSQNKLVLRCLDLPHSTRVEIAQWAEKRIGEKFNHLKMIGTVIPIPASKDGWYCSEIVCAAYKRAGVNLFPEKTSCYVYPADFEKSELLTKIFKKEGSFLYYFLDGLR